MTARVLSYPPRHDYVDRLQPDAARLVHRDEPWPALPQFYDPAWIVAHRGDWDVAHLHFTWEQYPPQQLAAVLSALVLTGTPIVWTVHDLRNPHTDGAQSDDAYLQILAEHADHIVALTPGAAAETAARFGRTADVVRHGPILDTRTAAAWRRRRTRPDGVRRLLLHAKSLRANLDWKAAMSCVSNLAEEGGPLRMDVLVHDDTPSRAAVSDAAGTGVRVRPHAPLSMDQLCAELVASDALILPYRWGTHSGLLELATDLGVPVIAADVGYLREQTRGLFYESGAPGLECALRQFASEEPTVPVPLDCRDKERAAFTASHRALYLGLLSSQETRAV
jgi:glycosyltransferase involved in cell wall biosynthesis